MAVEIKLDRVYTITDNQPTTGFVLVETRKKKDNKNPVVTKTYHMTIEQVLKYYVRDALAKKPEKIATIREYLDEYEVLMKTVEKITNGL